MGGIQFVEENQSDLDAQLDLIEERQKQLNDTLSTMEEEVSQLYTSTKLQQPDDERSSVYSQAENINKQLEEMSLQVKEMVAKLNASYNDSVDDNTDTNNIIQILNNHLNTLQWIDHKSGTLHQQVLKAETELKRSY
jgi:nuclear pore complex protein Nup62